MTFNALIRLLCITVIIAQLLPIPVMAASSSTPADRFSASA